MINIEQAVIVEGKYDKIKLSSVINGVIICTDGFHIFKDKEKMKLIRHYAEKKGIIILTDSDAAGFKIRNYLKGSVGGNIINVYIPDIFGKERRKAEPSKEGKLGVEGMPPETLLEILEQAGLLEGCGAPCPAAITKARCHTDASFKGMPVRCSGGTGFSSSASRSSRAASACWLSGLSSPSSAT